MVALVALVDQEAAECKSNPRAKLLFHASLHKQIQGRIRLLSHRSFVSSIQKVNPPQLPF